MLYLFLTYINKIRFILLWFFLWLALSSDSSDRLVETNPIRFDTVILSCWQGLIDKCLWSASKVADPIFLTLTCLIHFFLWIVHKARSHQVPNNHFQNKWYYQSISKTQQYFVADLKKSKLSVIIFSGKVVWYLRIVRHGILVHCLGKAISECFHGIHMLREKPLREKQRQG